MLGVCCPLVGDQTGAYAKWGTPTAAKEKTVWTQQLRWSKPRRRQAVRQLGGLPTAARDVGGK